MKEQVSRPQPDRVEPGFTLLELLVVIAIIALLAGMLLSALGQARHKVQAICCVSNYRQLQLAWGMYADDHQGHLPRNGTQAPQGSQCHDPTPGAMVVTDLGFWRCDAFGKTYAFTPGSWVLGNARWDLDDSGITHGSLWPYANSGAKVYHCPADRSPAQCSVTLAAPAPLPSRDFYGTRIASDGRVLDDPPVQLTADRGANHAARIAASPDGYLMVWAHRLGPARATRISLDGTSAHPLGIPLGEADAYHYRPVVACDGRDFLVVWQDQPAAGGHGPISGVIVAGDTGLPREPSIRLAGMSRALAKVDVAWVDEAFLVV